MNDRLTASVVVNTLNRAESLRELLIALRRQTFTEFEVVVVAGPCNDNTDEVMVEFDGEIKARWCPEANLSMSRNIGISATAGDIVVFIDDDALPEPGWLSDLLGLYDSDEVAGAGGVVFDHTGYGYQTQFILADRLGHAEYSNDTPFDEFCFPGTMRFPTLLGCNSSFRRDRLVEVGGFDEEYEYYLDETDVCVRMVDAGYTLRQGRRGAVHHKFLPSNIRDSAKVVVNNWPVIKNNLYFSFVNAREHVTLEALFSANVAFAEKRRDELRLHHGEKRLTNTEFGYAMEIIDAAWEPGLAAGLRGRVALYDVALEASHGGPFCRYPTMARHGSMMRIVLVTQTLPPSTTGGIGRYCLDLGRELARRGHDVRIITDGEDHNTVDLEDGVWVHRIVKESDLPRPADVPTTPANIWSAAGAVAEELVRLNRLDPIDVVYSPMWDVEGLAITQTSSVLSITALMTTMGITLRTRTEWSDNPEFMAEFGHPLMDLERWVAARSHGIHAISHAIATEVESAGAFRMDPDGVFVSRLGAVDRLETEREDSDPDDAIEVLFVGRLEHRKGIDLLLEALPEALVTDERIRVTFVGRDIEAADGSWVVQGEFERRHRDATWLSRVRFMGEVSEEALWDHYRTCDVFVAPSRFESFGLIYVEAMMAGRAVIALAVGAAPEVITDGITGVLVVPEDPGALAGAIVGLCADPVRRRSLGAAGRARFEDEFTVERMADSFEQRIRSFTTIRPGDPEFETNSNGELIELPDGSMGAVLGTDPMVITLGSDGRSTVVVWFDPTANDVDSPMVDPVVVVVDHEPGVELVSCAGGGFTHFVLNRATGSRVSITGGPHATFAALHVVPGSVES